MKKLLLLLPVVSLLLIMGNACYGQTNATTNSNFTNFQNDSIQLKNLISSLLKWHKNDTGADFEPMTNKPKDSIYAGIDWKKHHERILYLQKTNFFSQVFLDNYNQIAQHLDKELKQNKTKYFVGDLPPYDHPNEWCKCQDYPNNAWDKFKIISLKIADKQANFKWSFAKNSFYSVKARVENNVWKITELEGFQMKNFSW